MSKLKISREFVDGLERSMRTAEKMMRIIIATQKTTLTQAEKLRRLVLAATTPARQAAMVKFAKGLTPFYVPPRGKAAAKINKFMRGKAGR